MPETESTQVLKALVGLTTSLKHRKFFDVAIAITELDEDDLKELNEAVRLVRGFVNNV